MLWQKLLTGLFCKCTFPGIVFFSKFNVFITGDAILGFPSVTRLVMFSNLISTVCLLCSVKN